MGKTAVRLGSWAIYLFLAIGVNFAASRLEFPRLALRATQIMGVAVANPNDTAAQLVFTAFAEDGSTLANQSLTIPANSQVSVLASQIFPDADLSQVSWFRGQSMSNDLTGFFLLLDSESGQLDGADLPSRSRSVAFPQIEGSQTARNEISLVNPGGVEAHVTATLQQGTQVQERIFSLPGRGATQFDPREFFQLESIPSTATLEVHSDEDLLGFQLIIFAEGDSVGVNARSTTQRLNALYFPQVVLGGGFTNRLAVRNQSDNNVNLLLTAFSADGSKLELASNPVEVQLPGGEVFRSTLATLFGFEGEETLTGWLQVESDREAITGELVYRIGASGAAATVAAAESGSRRILLSHLATSLNFFTGLALLNPGQFPAAVRGVAVSAAAEPLGRFDLVLTPGQRISRLITELVPESDGQNGGLVWLESDSPIFAEALFGNGTSLLANIPPQPAPPRFRADLSFPPRLHIEPRQAAVTAAQAVQFSSDAAVSWQINEGSQEFGVVDATGLYLSPDPLPEVKTVSLSATAEGGVAAAGIDLLSSVELLASTENLTKIAQLPLSGRTFLVGTTTEPSGIEAGQSLYEIVDEELLPQTELGFSVQALLGLEYEPGSEALVVLSASGEIYLFEPGAEGLMPISGASAITAIAWDPLSKSVLTAIGTSIRGVELSGSSPTTASAGLARFPDYRLGSLAGTIQDLAVDRCSGDIFFSSSEGVVFRMGRADGKLKSLGNFTSPARIRTLYRRGVSCPPALELLVLDGEGSPNLLHPDSETTVDSWAGLDSLGDLGLAANGQVQALAEKAGSSRLLTIETDGIYRLNPLNPPVVELLPALSQPPGLDLEILPTTATAGQSADFNLYLRTDQALPSALVFSLDFDQQTLLFDDTDLNQDGLPDSILPLLPGEFSLYVSFDPEDENGQLHVVMADLVAPFSALETGKLFTISFRVAGDREGSSDILFSSNPPSSAADQSADLIDFDEIQAGTVTVTRRR